jgi:hypothetical protein
VLLHPASHDLRSSNRCLSGSYKDSSHETGGIAVVCERVRHADEGGGSSQAVGLGHGAGGVVGDVQVTDDDC